MLDVRPLTPERWMDFVRLFGARGACGGCWCMTFRSTRAEYEQQKGDGNKRAMKRLVDSGRVTGVIGYLDDTPVAWCSLEPRERIPWLGRTRLFPPLDDEPVWSIVCLFVLKEHRRTGLSLPLIEGAVRWAASQGARIVEAYPSVPQKAAPIPDVFACQGLAATFVRAGFKELARPSAARRHMRWYPSARSGR